jgi:hypothetical protein
LVIGCQPTSLEESVGVGGARSGRRKMSRWLATTNEVSSSKTAMEPKPKHIPWHPLLLPPPKSDYYYFSFTKRERGFAPGCVRPENPVRDEK